MGCLSNLLSVFNPLTKVLAWGFPFGNLISWRIWARIERWATDWSLGSSRADVFGKITFQWIKMINVFFYSYSSSFASKTCSGAKIKVIHKHAGTYKHRREQTHPLTKWRHADTHKHVRSHTAKEPVTYYLLHLCTRLFNTRYWAGDLKSAASLPLIGRVKFRTIIECYFLKNI